MKKRFSKEQLRTEGEISRALSGASSAFVDIVAEIVEDSRDPLTHDAQIYATIACLVEDLGDMMHVPNGIQKILECLKEEFE